MGLRDYFFIKKCFNGNKKNDDNNNILICWKKSGKGDLINKGNIGEENKYLSIYSKGPNNRSPAFM